MSDFIFTYPFNGFPFKLDKELEDKDEYFSWTLNREEAIKFYWRSYISDINVNLNVEITESGEEASIHKNFSTDIYTKFMADFEGIPSEISQRAIPALSDFMYSFFESSAGTQFLFYISPPLYKGEDEYEIKVWGSYDFTYESNYFRLYLGKSELDEACIQRYDFSLQIYDNEVPCVFFQRYGSNFGDEMQLSASASINATYV